MVENSYSDISYQNHYLPNLGIAMVTIADNREFIKDAVEAKKITIGKKTIEYIPWGETNNLPAELSEKVYKSPVLSSNMLFNILVSHQLGIKAIFKIPLTNGNFQYVEIDSVDFFLQNLIETTTSDIITITMSTGTSATTNVSATGIYYSFSPEPERTIRYTSYFLD
jgi:hypothetical protein